MTSLRDFLRAPRQQALFVAYVVRAVAGWVVALPLIGAVGASGVAALPNTDRAFFEPGGLFLLELFQREHRGLTAALYASLWLFCLAWVVRSGTTALLFASGVGTTLSAAAARAFREMPRFLGISGLELVTKVVLGGGAMLAFDLTESSKAQAGALSVMSQAAILLIGAATLMAVAVLADLCRAELLRSPRPSFPRALEAAAATAWQSGLPLASGWLLWLGTSAFLIAATARASELLDVGRPGAWRVLLVFGVHQATIAALCLFQTLWIGRVLALRHAEIPAKSAEAELS